MTPCGSSRHRKRWHVCETKPRADGRNASRDCTSVSTASLGGPLTGGPISATAPAAVRRHSRKRARRDFSRPGLKLLTSVESRASQKRGRSSVEDPGAAVHGVAEARSKEYRGSDLAVIAMHSATVGDRPTSSRASALIRRLGSERRSERRRYNRWGSQLPSPGAEPPGRLSFFPKSEPQCLRHT